MTRLVSIQTNFSSGEIDPLLRARVDLKQYQNGAETLTNVLVQPQGGVRRRGGLKYLMEIFICQKLGWDIGVSSGCHHQFHTIR
jgi:hypothetical protein